MTALVKLSSEVVAENVQSGHVIAVISVEGAIEGEIFTYTLADALEDRFEIKLNEETHNFELVVKNGPGFFNFENAEMNHFALSISASGDKGTSIEGSEVTITVTDENDAPFLPVLSNDTIDESNEAVVIGTLSATDEDGDAITYSLVNEDGTEATDSPFEIRPVQEDGVTSYVLATKAGMQVDADQLHQVHVKMDDGKGGVATDVVAVLVKDIPAGPVNHLPTVAELSNDTIDESDASVVVGTLSATDEDGDTLTYSLVNEDGTEATDSPFEIRAVEENGITSYVLATKAGMHITADQTHQIWIQVSDGKGGIVADNYAVTVRNVNDAPTALKLAGSADAVSVLEGVSVIGALTAEDEDGDPVAWSFDTDAAGGGNADGMFVIEDGKIKLAAGKTLDFEGAKNVFTIHMKASDGKGGETLKSFTINVADVVETVKGTSGKNVLKGGIGADVLNGGFGNDILTGGAGKDVFVFNSKLGTSTTDRKVNFDTITDFSVADDTIQLDNAIFKKFAKTGAMNKAFFTIGSKAKDKNDYVIYDKKTGVLSYDADGSGTKYKAVEFAKLAKNLKMTADDFVII
jgi:Ca2+-binding RTX toxin-like protein